MIFSISFFLSPLYAQVGINTVTPTADLEIVADADPGLNRYNGIIIPKVTTLPVIGDATFPTAAQSGLLLYLDTTDSTAGIYTFDGTVYVKLQAGAVANAFFDNGTTNFATTTTANVQREGNVSVGSSLNVGRLNIEIENSDPVVTRTGLRVRNSNNSTAAGTGTITYAADFENSSNTGNDKIGVRSVVTGSGAGQHIGIDNNVTDTSGLSSNYGIRSNVGNTDIVDSTSYGVFSKIGTGGSRGTNYAVYGFSQHGNTTSDISYSGYFRGDNFAIRSEDDLDGYDLPTVDGSTGQVLTTNGAGIATWQSVSSSSSIRTIASGTLSGTDDTVLITGNIMVPAAATTNIGKKYIIALGLDTASSTISTTGSGFLLPGDDETLSTTSIILDRTNSDMRKVMIQSDGTYWYILN